MQTGCLILVPGINSVLPKRYTLFLTLDVLYWLSLPHHPVRSSVTRFSLIGVATGFTVEETEREIRGAIEFHIEGLIEDGLPIPKPVSIVEYLEIAA